MRTPFSDRIAQLDPLTEHQEIAFLLAFHVFPWDTERALELALFRTFAIPSSSALLVQTGEFQRRPRKRYDDTELILFEILEHGYDSERGRRALRRMNRMHGHYTIPNEEFLYVLSTFIYEPIRWIARFGRRPNTEAEKLALFYYFRELGKRMGIRDIPEDYAAFEQFNIDYERAHFRYAESNRLIGEATLDLLLGFVLPRRLRSLGRPFVIAVMDAPLREAMGFRHPPAWLEGLVAGVLRLRARILSRLPERTTPRLGTRRRRPTYPEGYRIEEIGTFPQKEREDW